MSNFISPRNSNNSVSSTSRSGSRHHIKRSITEFAAPVKLSRHHRKDRYHDERGPQVPAANVQQQTRFSLDMPRSEGVTPMMSPDQSRRPSVMLQRDEENRTALMQAELKASMEEKLRAQQDKASSRVDGLKQSLDQLGTFSTSTSRQLDETYYAVLEKLSTLQSTMIALKDLAETSRNIHQGFDKDSREIENDITLQLAKLGQFTEQQGNIESLQTRIQDGRAKIRSLSDRVDIVRERIEAWEHADNEWQERTRKRLKTIWLFISIVALTMTLIYFGAQYVPPSLDIMNLDSGSVPRVVEAITESRNESTYTQSTDELGEDSGEEVLRKRAVDVDEALHAFDEL
ncbi:Fc.00g061910.m01.CDS01 [Cosmosporella sp. VM-42]